MKKLAIILILTGIVLAQPILITDPEPVIDVVLKKLNSQTLEAKTTTITTETVLHDKAELQTELDHIPEQIARHQGHIDRLNDRAVELQDMLDVLK